MNKFIKGKNYTIHQLDEVMNNNEITIKEYGSGCIGESFIVLEHEQSNKISSFLLIGATGKGYIYECIYTA